MAVTKYLTVDGMILGEVTNGVMRNYGTDALGSVVATYIGGAQENTYRYKPYGELLAKSGTAARIPIFFGTGATDIGQRTLQVPPRFTTSGHGTIPHLQQLG